MENNFTKGTTRYFLYIFVVLQFVVLKSYGQQHYLKDLENDQQKALYKQVPDVFRKDLKEAEQRVLEKPNDFKSHTDLLNIRSRISEVRMLGNKNLTSRDRQAVTFKKEHQKWEKLNPLTQSYFTKRETDIASRVLGGESDKEILLSESYMYFDNEKEKYVELARIEYYYLALNEYIETEYYINEETGELEPSWRAFKKENTDPELPYLYYKSQRFENGEWETVSIQNHLTFHDGNWFYLEESFQYYTTDFDDNRYVHSKGETLRDEKGRILKSVYYSLDPDGEIAYAQELLVTYENDLIKEYENYYYNEGMGWFGNKIFTEYNESNLKIRETIYSLSPSKQLELREKIETTYNSEGLPEEITGYFRSENTWLNSSREINVYTGGLLTMSTSLFYDHDGAAWIYNTKRTFEYNEHKNLTQRIISVYTQYNDSWRDAQKLTISYNADNKVLEETHYSYNWNSGTLEKTGRYVYEYSGNLETMTEQSTHNNGQTWENRFRRINGTEVLANNVTSEKDIRMMFEDGEWRIVHASIANYDELEREIRYEYISSYSAWYYSAVSEIEYYQNTSNPKVVIHYYLEKWDDEVYFSGSKEEIEFENDLPIGVKSYRLSSNSVYPDQLEFILREVVVVVYNENQTMTEIQFSVFDNEGNITGKYKHVLNFKTYGALCDFEISGETILLEGKVVLTAGGNSNNSNYIWKNSAGETLLKGASIEITAGGIYTVSPADFAICASKTIKVYNVCEIGIEGPENNVLFGSQGILTAVFAEEGEATYKWTNANEEVLGTDKSLTITAPGTYTIEAFSGLCYGKTSIEIKTFVTGTSGIEKERISVYPNPVSSGLTIRNLDGETMINIYSVDGRSVFRGRNESGSTDFSIDLSKERAGLYILELRSATSVEKFKLIRAN